MNDEPRVRAERNPGERGQVGNNNFAMTLARGEWIKPLFDDDAFKPHCLERFIDAIEASPGAGTVRCLADLYEHDTVIREGLAGTLPRLERLESDEARLAMYVQDFEIGTPIQAMIRRDLVQGRGVWWEKEPGLTSAVDTWWLFRLLEHGPLLLLNEPLVDQHWGHETGTTLVQRDPTVLDRDNFRLRELMHPRIPPELDPPSVAVTQGQVRLMRAALRLRDRRPLDAARLIAGAWRPASWRLAVNWARRQRRPGATPLVPREEIWPRMHANEVG